MTLLNEIKILLVEDDEDDYILFKDYLSDIKLGKYVLTWASNFDKGVSLIRNKAHDIYFFDYLLGRHTGLELIKECLKNDIPSLSLCNPPSLSWGLLSGMRRGRNRSLLGYGAPHNGSEGKKKIQR